MFRSFFLNRQWLHWSFAGSVIILAVTWFKVQLDVKINEWFGSFYNLIQKALAKPGAVTLDEYFAELLTYFQIAAVYVLVAFLLDFFIKHYIFRWRTAMNDYYTSHWTAVRHIEGAAQRIQEDTMQFARIMESLGVSFMRSIMTLIAFLPVLWVLSKQVKELPWIGPVDHSLVYIAILVALAGTVLLAVVGVKLPGLEFNNQRVEAAFRKELVHGEDDHERADDLSLRALFGDVRMNYFKLYFHYMYFDFVKWSYLMSVALVPYVALGPTLVAGAITLGTMQQILRAYNKVENSFQFLVNSWTRIIELISIYKRLQAFEAQIKLNESLDSDEALPQTT